MPKDKLQVATIFSGIGAAEFALKRLNIPHDIVFACDNGEIDFVEDEDKMHAELREIKNLNDRKAYIRSKIPARKTNFVMKSYMANYDIDPDDYYFNVRFLEGNEYRNKVDLFVGGSPCQSFTLLGYQKGLEEARGTLFYEFARLVDEIQPKAFIYENVQGLIKHDKHRFFDGCDNSKYSSVCDAFDEIGMGIFGSNFKGNFYDKQKDEA